MHPVPLAVDWTADLTSDTVTGLDDATQYWFNVVVRDENNNTTGYTSIDTTTLDVTAPEPGSSGTLTTTDTAVDGFTVNWTKATDNDAAQAELQYRVFYSFTSDIDTVSNINTNGVAATDWVTDVDTAEITSLTDATQYWANVLVRDVASPANEAAYAMVTTWTADGTAPTPGNSGTITTGTITQTSIVANWTQGSDNFTSPVALEYQVFGSPANNITTYGDALANGIEITSGWTAAIDTIEATGLSADTTYWLNVFIRDEAGNIAPYVPASGTTEAGGIPELACDSVLWDPAVGTPRALRLGGTLEIPVDFSETGGEAASSGFDVSVYLSEFPGVDPMNDQEIGSLRVGYLAGSGSDTALVTATIPLSAYADTYYIGAFVDSSEEYSEINEDDNTNSDDHLTILPENPGAAVDLVADEIWSPIYWNMTPTVEADAAIAMECCVASIGAKPGSGCTYRLYFTTDSENPDPLLDFEVGSATVSAYELSINEEVSVEGVAPTTPGTYYAYFVADADDAIGEYHEGNNLEMNDAPIQVLPTATTIDLMGEDCIHPDAVALDSPFTVSVSMIVSGETDLTSPVNVGVYLSTDDVFDGGDERAGSFVMNNVPLGKEYDAWEDLDSQNAQEITISSGTFSTGTYYVFYKLDYDEQLAEGNEDNNTGMSESPIVVTAAATAKADLGCMLYNPEANQGIHLVVNQGETSVPSPSVLVANRGGVDVAAGVSVSFYAATTQTVNIGSDTPLGSITTTEILKTGFNRTEAPGTLNLSALGTGTYWLYAYIDPADAYDELDETNNDSTNFSIYGFTGGSWIELTVTSSMTNPNLAANIAEFGGSTNGGSSFIECDVDVLNTNGGTTAGPSVVSFWLSENSNSTIDAADEYAGSTVIGALEGFEGVETWLEQDIPFGMSTSTTYYYKVKVDSLNEVSETDESNIVVSGGFTFEDQGGGMEWPDLSCSIDTHSNPLTAGTTVAVDVTFSNTGSQDVPGVDAALYLSDDDTLDGSDQQVGTWFDAVGIGQNIPHTFTFTVPDRQSTQYLIVVIDESGSIFESNEMNNQGLSPVTVTGGGGENPDIAALGTVWNEGQFSNNAIRRGGSLFPVVSCQELNGVGVGESFGVVVMLSEDEVIDAGDIPVGTWTSPSLAPSALATASVNCVIPTTVPAGEYFMGAVYDYQFAITESDESNNIDSGAGLVHISVLEEAFTGGQYDLAISALYSNLFNNGGGTAQLGRNESVAIEVDVESLGDLGFGDAQVQVFLSPDQTTGTPGDDVAVATGTFGTADVGDTLELTGSFAGTAGTYYVYAVVDTLNAVTETDETNNVYDNLMEIEVVETGQTDMWGDEAWGPREPLPTVSPLPLTIALRLAVQLASTAPLM